MKSESIVVLVLVALAIGFIIWVRMNSRDHDRVEQTNNNGEEGESNRNRK